MPSRSDPLRMERATLDGGIDVVLQPAPSSARSFSITYVAPAGWGNEPAGAEGLAGVVARLMVTRPGRRSREELARTLDRLGASLTSHVDPESAEITVGGPDDAWAPLLRIFSDAVLRPYFDHGELERTLRQLRVRQLRQQVQPDLRSGKELMATVFPRGHPYHSSGLGTARSLPRLTLDRARAFHRERFPVRTAVIAVTSHRPAGAVLRVLRREFPAAALRAPRAPPEVRLPAGRSRRTDITIPGQSQVSIRLATPTAARSAPDYPERFLANEVLGGRPLLSRLFQHLRERNGLVYHASSELEAMLWGGYWEAVAGSDPQNRDRVVRMILAEVERMSTDLVPASELNRIRESSLGAIPLELETTGSAHDLAVDVAYHRLPTDYYLTWAQRLRAISPKALRAAAESGFPRDRTVVVTVGPPPR